MDETREIVVSNRLIYSLIASTIYVSVSNYSIAMMAIHEHNKSIRVEWISRAGRPDTGRFQLSAVLKYVSLISAYYTTPFQYLSTHLKTIHIYK